MPSVQLAALRETLLSSVWCLDDVYISRKLEDSNWRMVACTGHTMCFESGDIVEMIAGPVSEDEVHDVSRSFLRFHASYQGRVNPPMPVAHSVPLGHDKLDVYKGEGSRDGVFS